MEDWLKHIEVATISDIGMRRSTNQDSFDVALAGDFEKWKKRGHFFLVADGMGAHAAGELASKLAADGITHLYSKYQDLSPPEALKRAVIETNAEINRRGQANEEFNNMGTTCSALALLPYGAIVAHVGDSRVYRIRNNKLEQLTFDHSLVWEMKSAGTIPGGPEGEALIPKNVITRSLGPYPDVNVDLEGPFPIRPGDRFLLCSDGLTGEVEDDEIASLVSYLAPDRAARVLVDLANLRGGPDNITILIASVVGEKLATTGEVDKPLTVGGVNSSRHPGVAAYACLGASLLGGIICALMGSWLIAVPLFAVAAALLGFVIMKLTGAGSGEKVVGERARFGRGPYTRSDAVSGSMLMGRLESIGDQLRAAAREGDLPVDLAGFDKSFSKAKQAAAAGDDSNAVNHFCAGLSNYMDQLRG